MRRNAKVDRREPCAEFRKHPETSPQVHLDIRRKNGGEAGETKDNRKGRDWHIVVEVLCNRQSTGGAVREGR